MEASAFPAKDTIISHSRPELSVATVPTHLPALCWAQTPPSTFPLAYRVGQYLHCSNESSPRFNREQQQQAHQSNLEFREEICNKQTSKHRQRRGSSPRILAVQLGMPLQSCWPGPAGSWMDRKRKASRRDSKLQGQASPFQITFSPYLVLLLAPDEAPHYIKGTNMAVDFLGLQLAFWVPLPKHNPFSPATPKLIYTWTKSKPSEILQLSQLQGITFCPGYQHFSFDPYFSHTLKTSQSSIW